MKSKEEKLEMKLNQLRTKLAEFEGWLRGKNSGEYDELGYYYTLNKFIDLGLIRKVLEINDE